MTCPSILPNSKVTVEENFSTHYSYPCGMLDRDQRTTFRIEKYKKNTIHFSRRHLTTHTNSNQTSADHYTYQHHQNNSDATSGTNFSDKCENVCQTKDNNITVKCPLTKNLLKFDFNRSRTKYPIALPVIAWIIVFTINITYSEAGPLRSDCSAILNETTGYNRDQTNFSMTQLAIHMKYYQMITNISDKVVSEWSHLAGNIGETNIEDLFDGTPFMEVFKTNLQLMYDHLVNVAEHFKFFHCMHNHVNFTGRTTHNMNLDETRNNLINSYLDEIHSYTNLSIIQIKDTSRDLNLNLDFKDILENCNLHNNTSVVREVVIMKKLEGILKYMSGFFDYIEQNICKK